jgi:hypothetical protein
VDFSVHSQLRVPAYSAWWLPSGFQTWCLSQCFSLQHISLLTYMLLCIYTYVTYINTLNCMLHIHMNMCIHLLLVMFLSGKTWPIECWCTVFYISIIINM